MSDEDPYAEYRIKPDTTTVGPAGPTPVLPATDPYAEYRTAPPPAGEPTARITVTPPAAPAMSQAEAALHGYRAGASANFGDEIYGLSEASGLPRWMGGFRAPVGAARMLYERATTPTEPDASAPSGGLMVGDPRSKFMRDYEEAVAQRRGEEKAAEQQYPGTFLAGQVGGSLLMPGAAYTRAATLPARMGRSAVYGAGYGTLSGAGAGENDLERAKGAAMGGVLGLATGGVVPAAVEGVLAGGRAVTAPIASTIRGAVNPQNEAARYVGNALGADTRIDPTSRTRLTPHEYATNVAQGGPATVMDLGGEATRGLARTAANTSPEARGILNATIDPRFETQSDRVAGFLRDRLNYPNVTAQEQALAQTGRTTNTAAYRRAYAAGAGNVGSPELERLASSDAVASAMRSAAAKAKDEAVASGYGAMNPRVTFTPDGRVQFQRSPSGMPLFPDLQFWDLTRRELSDAADAAQRAGRNAEARRLGSLARALNTELDTLIPEYAQARAGAAHFFGAQNALEAGGNFFGQARRFGTEPARQALGQMSPLERQLFSDAWGSRLINQVEGIPARQNVVPKFANSNAANAELDLALGRQTATDLRGVRRTEDIMDRARQTVQGNSTTARQLAEMYGTSAGLYGGAAGVGLYGAYNQDPAQVTLGALGAAFARGRGHVNQNVMREVANILTSQNPGAIGRNAVAQQIMANPAALRAATTAALGAAGARSMAREQRAAITRSLLARGLTGAAIPPEVAQSR